MNGEKILVINTGGTIGMVNSDPGNPLSPLVSVKTEEEFRANFPILDKDKLEVDFGLHLFEPLLDSSDIKLKNWQDMAQVISDNYEKYTGFVILHGTDTMCYTASALSFMLENLDKPIIITGSQIPMVRSRSDAAQNLVTSIQIAAHKTFGYPIIPEVCIFFRDVLIRGNRSRKLSSSGYSGFKSPNYPPLAAAGEYLVFEKNFISNLPSKEEKFFVNTFFDNNIMVLEIFPGFDPKILKGIFDNKDSKIKGLILKTFGSGNTPSSPEFLEAIEYVSNKDIVIVDVTQCPEGIVELGLYEASVGLLNRGVISGVDLTPEAAVCKLMYMLGQGWNIDEVKRQMQLNKRGEQSRNIFDMDFSKEASAEPTFKASTLVPGDIDFQKFEKGVIRFQGAYLIDTNNNKIHLKVFINHPQADENTPDNDPRLACIIEKKIKNSSSTDLFADISDVAKTLIRKGQMNTITIVAADNSKIKWDKMSLSIHTKAK